MSRVRSVIKELAGLDGTLEDDRSVCFSMLAWAWLTLLTVALWVYFHPLRIFVNGDDGWPVLEIAYRSLRRDGLWMWGSDRHGALHVQLAQVLLHDVGLSRWISHPTYLGIQQGVLTLLGLGWLGRRARTFFIMGPLIVLTLVHSGSNAPQSLEYWFVRPGTAYPMVMCSAVALLVSLGRIQEQRANLWWSYLAIAACGVWAFVCSPGNVVLAGVWLGIGMLGALLQGGKRWRRWVFAAIVLGIAYWVRQVSGEWYDHEIHQGRMHTPMGLAWEHWKATGARLFCDYLRAGVLTKTLTVLGIAGGVTVGGIGMVLGRKRLSKEGEKITRLYWMMVAVGVAAGVYALLLPANEWVRQNPQNPSYVLPVMALALVGAGVEIEWLVRRWSRWAVLGLGAVLLAAALARAWMLRPREESQTWRDARKFLNYAANAGVAPLMGSFWTACVYSYYDPIKIISAPFDVDFVANIMWTQVVARGTVLVNFRETRWQTYENFSGPELFVHRGSVLRRSGRGVERDIPAGWYTYQVVDPSEVYVGSNLLVTAREERNERASREDGGIRLAGLSNDSYAEVVWPLGRVSGGLYLITFSARCTGGYNSGAVVLHLYERDVNDGSVAVVAEAGSLGDQVQHFHNVVECPGSVECMHARLYSLAREEVVVERVGVFSLQVREHVREPSN